MEERFCVEEKVVFLRFFKTLIIIPPINKQSHGIARCYSAPNFPVTVKPLQINTQWHGIIQLMNVSTRTYSTNYFQRLTLESWYTNLEKLLTDVNNYRHRTNDFIHDVNETDKRISNRLT